MKRMLNILLATVMFVTCIVGSAIPVNAQEETTVIALDPGHDARHAGASAGGLREEELTLKIAYYCKEELEKYDDIEVYMTRTTNACPYPGTSSSPQCIEKRMLSAEEAGASFYISLHLNAQANGTSAHGAEVIYPNSSWKEEVGSRGKELAQYIQNQLTGLGLYDRGIYYKNTTIGEIYPDGSVSDYYTVQIAGKESGIPSVIVENAFITNPTDRSNFLSTETGLKQLGVASANAIAKMLGKRSGWEYIDDHWYYYSEGVMQTGWVFVNGIWYYMDEDGIMQTGWALVDGEWYYMDASGAMQTGWLLYGGERYYLNPDGAMQRGFKTINGTKYFFNTNGEVVDGAKAFVIDVSHWQGTIDWDKVARTEVDGVIVRCGHGDETTEQKWQDQKFEENISALKRLKIPYGIYHYNTATTVEQARIQAENAVQMMRKANAAPILPVFVDIEQDAGVCDLVAIAKVYMEVFASNGYRPGIYANANYWKNYLNDSSLDGYQKWIASYGVNDGYASAAYNPKEDFGDYMMWQYTSRGIIDGITENTVDCNVLFDWYEGMNGWLLIDGEWFYYVNGNLTYGWRDVNGIWYYFANNGVMTTGWQLVNGRWYYMDASGAMTTGWQLVNGRWYYMDASGAMTTGWQLVNGRWYYMDASGAWIQ